MTNVSLLQMDIKLYVILLNSFGIKLFFRCVFLCKKDSVRTR